MRIALWLFGLAAAATTGAGLAVDLSLFGLAVGLGIVAIVSGIVSFVVAAEAVETAVGGSPERSMPERRPATWSRGRGGEVSGL